MKTAIVTGAGGFIGKALIEKLIEYNIEVYAIARDTEKLQDLKDKVHIIKEDFLQIDKIDKCIPKKIDVFYHMVWEGGVYGAAFKDYELQLKNSKYACDALMLAVRLECKKFVLPGTVNEYEALDLLNMHNNDIPRYTNIYSSAKLISRMMCKVIAMQNKIEFCTGLISKAYGKGDTSKTIVNIVLKKLSDGIAPDLVKGENLYDFVYIEDVAEAFYRIGNKGKNGKAYYIGHREVERFRNYIEKLRTIVAPKVELKFGVYPDDAEIDYSLIDLDALYNDTGFECKADFEESILKTAQWVKTLDF